MLMAMESIMAVYQVFKKTCTHLNRSTIFFISSKYQNSIILVSTKYLLTKLLSNRVCSKSKETAS